MDVEAFDRKYVRRDALIKGLTRQIYIANKFGADANECLAQVLENVQRGRYAPSYRAERDREKRDRKRQAASSDTINEPNEVEWF